MPLPEYPPKAFQAPSSAGIGLRFNYQWRTPMPNWPDDWWQRDLDDPVEWDTTSVEGPIMTDRMMRLPEPP